MNLPRTGKNARTVSLGPLSSPQSTVPVSKSSLVAAFEQPSVSFSILMLR